MSKAHHKQANPRSEFLSELMKLLGGGYGASVISSYKDNDIDRFRNSMGEIINKLVEIMDNQNTVIKKMEFSAILKGGVGSGKVGHKTVKEYARTNGHKTNNTSIGANYVKQVRNDSAMFNEHAKASKHLLDNGFKETSKGLFEHSDGTQVRSTMNIEHTRSGGSASNHTLKVNEGINPLAVPF